MAFPAALAGIGAGASIFGGLESAEGEKYTAAAQAANYQYQAGVAQQNAAIAGQEAQYASATGESQAQQKGIELAQQRGQARAAFGASNTTGASQSAVTKGITDVGQLQEANIRANAAKKAYGFKVAGAGDVAQAGAYITGASTATTAGGIAATGTILGSVGSVASKWAQASQSFGSMNLFGQ